MDAAPAPRSQRKTHGPIASVPCPWCKRSNDLRGMAELEKGDIVTCAGCDQKVRVVAVKTMPEIILEQHVEEVAGG